MSPAARAPVRIGVLIGGGGRTLANLVERIRAGTLNAEVAVVIARKADLPGVRRARELGLAVEVIDREVNGCSIDDRITAALLQHRVDLVVLAGYLKPLRVDPPFVGRVMNIHPALLPAFGGKGMYGLHVHKAVLASGSGESGCTVHFVDEVYDNGPIIVQERCEVRKDDTPESLAARVFALECEAYPKAIGLYAAGRLRVEGRTVRVLPAGGAG